MDLPRALSFPVFRRFLVGRSAAVLARAMFAVTVGWELYELTRSTYSLALVGLVQVLPVVLLAVRAGNVIDRGDRRRIAMATQLASSACAIGFAALAFTHAPPWTRYPLLLLYGSATAFNSPAVSTLLPRLVPAAALENANAWAATSWELSGIAGPALAGLLIALRGDATFAYAVFALGSLGFAGVLATLTNEVSSKTATTTPNHDAMAGLRFVLRSKYLLPAITLDLFAVLLGGATALLPVYARDVLHVGPGELGWLRSAPPAGAFLMALVTTRLRPWRRPGVALLAAVAGFGAATVGFGMSRSFALSLVCLALTGLFDNVSVVIRMTLEQMATPDPMRGRVSAIQYVFIGLSNELGEFESGVAAGLLGPVGAVVFGGLGTLAVVGVAAAVWPQLLTLGPLASLASVEPDTPPGGPDAP